ncbi:Crp/Fnr family transcriptional regulator [Parapedobacter sp. DT-150]|uniref:Crp/Fnr family transcriptional regulator n=1 Tax=Parapedobacter sp. DT-150 TaxID=3396162 RepID=UPI003F19F1FF
MRNELVAFLSQFHSLTGGEMVTIASLMTVREVDGGTVLVREGEICNACYFVLKGCLRQYVVIDGVERTTRFFTENEAAVLFTSYTNRIPSDSYLSSVEHAVLLIGDPETDAELYRAFPKLEGITRTMMERDLGKTQDALSRFITSSPEERYLDLLENRPDLLQRVPQHQLASYIGVTPESLSRIRKRIFRNRRI